MKRFQYVVRTRDGTVRKGSLEADGIREAAKILREQGFFVVRLEASGQRFRFLRSLRKRGNLQYAALFCRQLSVMLDEQPLNEILGMLAKQKGDPAYQTMMQDMQREIELGKSLSEAMGKHGEVFSPNVIHMVEAGQESGNLTKVLERLADFLERQYAERKKLESAMLYPVFIGMAVLCAICFLIMFVLPTFAVLFESFQTELPLPTRIMLHLGRFAEIYGVWIPVGFLVILAGAAWIYHVERYRCRIDYWILKIPFWGRWKQETAWMQILNTLAVELEGGVRMDAALRMVREVPSNRYLQQILGQLQESVSHGYPLARFLENCPVFPAMLTELVAAGESTGRLEDMLRKSADYCALSAENLSQRLQAVMEPAMLMVLGSIVLGFVLSVVLPLLEMMDQTMG